jgi:ABC-type lipoprotein release transport system permease subunit
MWLLKMGWKNLWRNKYRTFITVSAIFFAVILATVVSSLQKGVFDNLIKNVVGFYTGYIQVHHAGYWDEQILENSFEQNPIAEKSILKVPGVIGIAPRLESFALAASDQFTKGCMVIGISPLDEDKVTQLKAKITQGSYLQTTDKEVIIAEGLASRLRLQLNDTLILIGQGYHGATAAGKFKIKGILKFGSPDLNTKTVFMPLLLAQELYSAENELTSYVVSIDNPDRLDAIAGSIRKSLDKNYEVMTWEEMMPSIVQHISTDKASMSIIIGILYLLISFGIFGTLLMMMVERKFEIGMLIAIGMKKVKLCFLLLAECILTTFTGCVLGLLISTPIVWYLKMNPISFGKDVAKVYEQFGFEPIFPATLNIDIFIRQALIVLIIGLVLSLYPVINIIRINPIKAMRGEV